MKYGDTLRQRSIPEWALSNIDYDQLKDLIKHQTTSGTVKAVSIPGQGETSERAFSDTFFQALKDQHDRINRFIRSKSGEIDRRLEYISKCLQRLQARNPSAGPGGRLPARTVEQYAKIDADITRAGEEIRSLSRFQVTQEMGFRKILKKYKRWTKDKELEKKFRQQVTASPDSFFQLDLGYLLDQYIDVLSALRALFVTSVAPAPSSGAKSSSMSRIAQAAQEGTEVDFDVAFSITPLGLRGSKASYWIHSDHIVEVEVLLLQHMRLYQGPSASTPQISPKTTPMRRRSSATVDKYFGNEDTVGQLVLDHPEAFAIKQNASTIGSCEETTGTLQAKAAGNARWTSSGDAAVAIGLDHSTEDIITAKLKRNNLATFLDSSTVWNDSLENGNQERDDATKAREWIVEHKEVKPIAGVCSKRTRLVGLHNNNAGGMWATLDRDVFMKKQLHQGLQGEDWLSEAREDSIGFPHTVLEIRREGSNSSALIKSLDSSHLVERIRGFSMEAHSVWMCCRPDAMSTPVWISTLDKDIRKLPPPMKRQRRRPNSSSGSQALHSPIQTSASTTSLTDGQTSPYTSRNGESSATSAPEFVDPPPLRAFRKKRKAYSDYPPPLQAEPEGQRYWNEYDNPESEDEGYFIYLDPNESMKFPGQDFFEACAAKTRKFFRIRDAPEEGSTTSAAESSDDETADESSPLAAKKGYGTIATRSNGVHGEGYFSGLFRTFRDPHRELETWRENERERRTLISELQVRRHSAEMTKFLFYSTCIVMAVVIDSILGMMTMTARKKEKGVVDFGVLVGAIFNVLLCGIAVFALKMRRDNVGWVHQAIVGIVVLGNFAVDVALLFWVFAI